MNEPLEAKKAPDANGGEGEARTPQPSQLEAFRSSDYPNWPAWQLRWREIVNSGGTILCSPEKIRGTRLERWALEHQRVLPLSGITTLRDTKWPQDFGICNNYEELPRPNHRMRRLARGIKGQIVLCSCPKQAAYARVVMEILRAERQYQPSVWSLMMRELEAQAEETGHLTRLLKAFYAIDPTKLPAWLTSIDHGFMRGGGQ